MSVTGLHVRQGPDMKAERAAAFHGWTVRTRFGVATVRDEGDHFAVRVPVRLNWGCHFRDGARYMEGRLTTVGVGPISYLIYRAAVSSAPVAAVRMALVHGVKEGE